MHNSSILALYLLSVILSTFNFSSDIPTLCFNHRGAPSLIYIASVDVGRAGAWVAHDCLRACEMSLAVQEKADGGRGAEVKVAPLRVAEVPLTERGLAVGLTRGGG